MANFQIHSNRLLPTDVISLQFSCDLSHLSCKCRSEHTSSNLLGSYFWLKVSITFQYNLSHFVDWVGFQFTMQGIWRNRVNSAVSKQLTLEKTLHTLWDWLKYSGLHPNLLLISVQQRSASDILRWVFTLITLLLVLVLFVFESIQLIIKSWSVQNMVDIVPNVIFIVPHLYSFIFQYYFWFCHHQIKQFFGDWKIIERQMNCSESSKLKQNIKRLCIMIYSCNFFLIILFGFWNWIDSERSFFLTHYFVIQETFVVLLITMIVSVVCLLSSIFRDIYSTIPMICFYIIACHVENLGKEWELSSKNERFLRVIWQRYERILHLINRANEVFGPIINGLLLNNILQSFMTIFYALVEFQRSLTAFLVVLILSIYVILSIVMFNRFMSRLYFSKDKLQKSIADHLSLKWYQLNENDRKLLVTFLARLERDDMCVRPTELYSINPSNLLNILALIINYFIVLTQAK